MAQAPAWTAEEFETVLNNPELQDGELATKLGRSVGSVGFVRFGIHVYQLAGEDVYGQLTQEMRDRLDKMPEGYSCNRCLNPIEPYEDPTRL